MKKGDIVNAYIIRCIRTGNLQEGDFLPSIRTVADDLNISKETVFNAYCRLEQEGLVLSRDRQGFELIDASYIPDRKIVTEYYPPPITEIQLDHFNATDQGQKVQLGALSPPNDYFPSDELSKSLSRIARTYPDRINTYGFTNKFARDILPIEQIIASYMYKMLGIVISYEEICPSIGATGGMMLALRTVAHQGDLIAVECPGYIGVHNLAQLLNLNIIGIDVNPETGLNINSLEKNIKNGFKPRILVVTPNFQNPTGALMPFENRMRLIELCKKHDIIIIEDDVLGALRYSKRISSLKELAPDDIIYVNSFSKVLAPGYRVGWVAGGKYHYNIRIYQGLESSSMPIANHLSVVQYIKSEKSRNYIINLRKIYKENSNKMADVIEQSFPKGTIIYHPQGGQYLWVELPRNVFAADLFNKAAEYNIVLAPGTLFNTEKAFEHHLRFCYAMKLNSAVINAIETVAGLI